jgi:hypothetical protein
MVNLEAHSLADMLRFDCDWRFAFCDFPLVI